MAIGVGLTRPGGGGGAACTSRGWVRNPDWLTMPDTTNGDDSIFILSAVFDNDVPNFMAFLVNTSSGDFTVDLYNDETTVTNHTDASTASFNLDYSKGTDEITDYGYKQVITKITPATGNMEWFYMYVNHPDAVGGWDSGVLSVKITSQTITYLQNCFRGTTGAQYHRRLEEFEWFGTCNATNTSYMFESCTALGKVKGNFEDVTTIRQMFSIAGDFDYSELQLPTSGLTTAQSGFRSSYLREIKGSAGAVLFQGAEYAITQFENCDILTIFGTRANPVRFDSMTHADGFKQMFNNCFALTQAHFLEAQTVPKNLYRAFRNCYAVQTIMGIDCTDVTNTTGLFDYARSLSWLRISNMPISFSLEDCNFSQEGLVQVFTDLPDLAGGSATITVTDNPGTGDLTAANLLIATNKDWTVTT